MFPKGETSSGWKMTKRHLATYAADPMVKAFRFATETLNWW